MLLMLETRSYYLSANMSVLLVAKEDDDGGDGDSLQDEMSLTSSPDRTNLWTIDEFQIFDRLRKFRFDSLKFRNAS